MELFGYDLIWLVPGIVADNLVGFFFIVTLLIPITVVHTFSIAQFELRIAFVAISSLVVACFAVFIPRTEDVGTNYPWI